MLGSPSILTLTERKKAPKRHDNIHTGKKALGSNFHTLLAANMEPNKESFTYPPFPRKRSKRKPRESMGNLSIFKEGSVTPLPISRSIREFVGNPSC